MLKRFPCFNLQEKGNKQDYTLSERKEGVLEGIKPLTEIQIAHKHLDSLIRAEKLKIDGPQKDHF